MKMLVATVPRGFYLSSQSSQSSQWRSHSDFEPCLCALFLGDGGPSLIKQLSNICCSMLTGVLPDSGIPCPSHSCFSSAPTPEFLSTVHHLGNIPDQTMKKIIQKKKKRERKKRIIHTHEAVGNGYSFGRQLGSTQKIRKAYTFQQNHPTPRNLSCKCIWASAQSCISKMFGAELLIVVKNYKEQECTSIGWLRFLTVFILRCFFLILCWNLLLGPRFASRLISGYAIIWPCTGVV